MKIKKHTKGDSYAGLKTPHLPRLDFCELRYILKDNNVDFDYAKLEKDAIERYKKKC